MSPRLHRPPAAGRASGPSASVGVLLVALFFGLGGCADDGKKHAPPEPSSETGASETGASETGTAETAVPPDVPQGELHLRIEAGVVLRQGPGDESPAVAVLENDGLFPVLEQQQGVYRIPHGADGGAGSGGAWVRGPSERVKELRMRRSRLGPQPIPEPAPVVVDAARRHLRAGGRALEWGPYRVLTDVDDAELLDACGRLAERMDPTYTVRFGAEPVGENGGRVFLFARQEDFRAFADARGDDARGHAGLARAAEGYLALYLGDRPPEIFVTTLVHELAHMVSRRALGAPLPRWLSEGLADGMGDPASLEDLGSVVGLAGAETPARRVLEVPYLPDLEALFARGPDEFDTRPRARDYEESAVLVRYLLSDRDFAPAFRAFLGGVAEGEPADGPTLLRRLGLSPTEGYATLDRRLRRWLEAHRD